MTARRNHLAILEDEIIECREVSTAGGVPRKSWRGKSAALPDCEYWGKPVPGFAIRTRTLYF